MRGVKYVDSFASSFAVVARRMWFSVKGYSATSFNSAVLRLAAIPVARLVQPEPQGPAVQMSQHHRPANPQRQHSAPRAAIQSTVRSDITLDAAFATAGRAKQLDDDGKLTAAVLAYEQVCLVGTRKLKCLASRITASLCLICVHINAGCPFFPSCEVREGVSGSGCKRGKK